MNEAKEIPSEIRILIGGKTEKTKEIKILPILNLQINFIFLQKIFLSAHWFVFYQHFLIITI